MGCENLIAVYSVRCYGLRFAIFVIRCLGRADYERCTAVGRRLGHGWGYFLRSASVGNHKRMWIHNIQLYHHEAHKTTASWLLRPQQPQ